jgi:hypothetical protein
MLATSLAYPGLLHIQVSMVGQCVHHGARTAGIASNGSNPWLDVGSLDLSRKGHGRSHQTDESEELHREGGLSAGSRLQRCSRLGAWKERDCQHLLCSSSILDPSISYISVAFSPTALTAGPCSDRRTCNYMHRRREVESGGKC